MTLLLRRIRLSSYPNKFIRKIYYLFFLYILRRSFRSFRYYETMARICLNRVCARAVQEKLYQSFLNKPIYQQTRNQFTNAGSICLTKRIADQYNGFNLHTGNRQVRALTSQTSNEQT